MPKCTKCKKKFVSQYLLDKHLNREIPCDQEIKCEKCDKKFEKKRDLERHMNRKTPCVSIKHNLKVLELEKEQEKTKQEEEKTKRELEKTRQEAEKTKRELEKLKLKIELENKKQQTIEKESESKKEEIELRKLKNLEIEKVKTERKEKTASIINNINTQNIKIEVTNNINNMFDAKIVLDSDKFKTKDVSHLFEIISNPKIMEQLCKDNNSLTNLLANIIKIAYNNDNIPESRYFVSDKESDHFLIADENSGQYKIVDYNDIEKYIKKTTNNSYNEIKKIIDKNVLPRSKAEEFKLYENMYINGNFTLKTPAIIGLDPDNRIEKSEQGFVRIKKTNKYNGYFSDSSDEDEYD